jgi:putative transposase
VSSVALKQKLRDLEQAFQHFFGGRAGSPNFKRKHGKQTARFASNAFTRYGNAFTLYGKALSVAKVPGDLNVRWSRDLSGTCTVTSVTLTNDPAGRYFASLTCFVSLTCTEKNEALPETDQAVGIDLGITALTSASPMWSSPRAASRAPTQSTSATTCIAFAKRSAACLAKRRGARTGRSRNAG